MLDAKPQVATARDDDLERCTALLEELAHRPAEDRRNALRDRVIEGFLPVADRLARRYAHGHHEEDLTQVARLGLIKAVDGFDPDRGPFLAYAVPTIRGELKRYFRDRCWDIRAPRRLQELRAAAHLAEQALEQELRRSPTPAEVAAAVGASTDDVIEALDCDRSYTVASLNAPAPGSADGYEIGDLFGVCDPALETAADRVSLRSALTRLPDRERQMIRWRFVDGLTQSQIADRLGISQMHVSRLLTRTLDGLHAWIEGERDDLTLCHPRDTSHRPAAAA
jgi:RNA polymerase sigma-B factor